MAIVDSTNWSTRSLNIFNTYYALPTQYSSLWGTFLFDNSIQDQGIYEFDIRFLETGIQVFGTAADDEAQFYIDGEYLGDFGPLNDNQRIFTTKYYDALTVHRLTFIRTDTGIKPTSIAARWIRSEYNPVDIRDFDAAPRVLTNTTNTILNWDIANARKIEINQNVGDVTGKTTITYTLPAITGIDAPISVTGDDYVLVTTGVSESYTKSITVNNNAVVKLRFPSPDFSQDPFTLDNKIEYYVDFGTIRKYFTVVTRAPNDNEIFDFSDVKNSVPYPVPPGNSENPPQYLVSPETVEPSADQWQVELQYPNNITLQSGVEVKTTYNDKAQVRVRPFGGSWGSWVNTEYLYDEIIDPGPKTIENMNWATLGTRNNGNISNSQPRSINTRSSGILTAKNIAQ